MTQENTITNTGPRDAAAILAAGAATAKPYERKNGEPPIFVLPGGYALASPPVRDFIVQTITTDSVDSFVDYVKKYGTGKTLVLEQLPDTASALIDYHSTDKPAPNRHRLMLRRRYDNAFRAWDSFVSRSTVDQRSFVEFVEEHTEDVVDPTSGALLDMIRKVEAKTEVSYSSVISESGLQKAVFAETSEARSGEKGSVEIPRLIKLGIPLFFNGEVYELTVRVRLAIHGGKLQFRLAWLNKDKALELDAEHVVAGLREKLSKTCTICRGEVGNGD